MLLAAICLPVAHDRLGFWNVHSTVSTRQHQGGALCCSKRAVSFQRAFQEPNRQPDDGDNNKYTDELAHPNPLWPIAKLGRVKRGFREQT